MPEIMYVIVVVLAVAGGLVLLPLVWFIVTYNGLIAGRNRVKDAWSGIDVDLKRRYDLIPNLVETVKGYAKHERELLERVTEARAACLSASGPAESAQAENFLTQTLKSLFAVAENYPDLKANQNFLQLQGELAGTENRVAGARKGYNGEVRRYNTRLQSVPANIVAGICGFKAEEFFETGEAAAREPVKVKF